MTFLTEEGFHNCYPVIQNYFNKTIRQLYDKVEPGQMIKKGDLIAKIESPNEATLEELFAPRDGVVLGYTDETISRPGQEIVALGLAN